MRNQTEQQASARRLYYLLGFTVALILYGSTYPWDFRGDFREFALAGNPLRLLFSTWAFSWSRWVFRDLTINVGLYLPLGVLGFLALRRSFSKAVSIAGALVGGAALSTSIEILQIFETSRSSSAVDVAANTAGTALGILLGHTYREKIGAWASARVTDWSARARGAVALLVAWAAYQIFPLFPALSTTRLRLGLSAMLGAGAFSGTEFLAACGECAGVAALVASLGGSGRTLGVVLLLVPARLLIAGRTLHGAELLAAPAAWLLWTGILSRRAGKIAWAGGLVVLSIVVRGLAPLRFSASPLAFSWIPFAAALSVEYSTAAPVLLRKAFVYGAALWLLTAAGWSRVRAAAFLIVLLAAIEAVQVFLPPHVPEVTDPLLALLLAILLKLLESGGRANVSD